MKRAVASTMQTQRTVAARPWTKALNKLTKVTRSPLRRDEGPANDRRRSVLLACGSEILLRIEDESDSLFDSQPFGLLSHEPRHGLYEGCLVGRDNLGEVAFQCLQVLDLRNLPCAAHIGLRACAGLGNCCLLLVVELRPELHRADQEIRYAHMFIERVVLCYLVEFLGHHGRMVVLCTVHHARL